MFSHGIHVTGVYLTWSVLEWCFVTEPDPVFDFLCPKSRFNMFVTRSFHSGGKGESPKSKLSFVV